MSESQKQVRLTATTNKLLSEIVEQRRKEDHLNCTKQGIVAEVVMVLHKKEMAAKRAKQ